MVAAGELEREEYDLMKKMFEFLAVICVLYAWFLVGGS